MRKQIFCFALCAMLLALSFSAQAQQEGKDYRIGYLSLGSAQAYSSQVAVFRRGLRELGYVEGKNIVIEERYAAGRRERLPALATELSV